MSDEPITPTPEAAPAKRKVGVKLGTEDTVKLRRQCAALTAMGLSPLAVSKELHVDNHTVARMLESTEVKEWIEEIGDDAIRAAKSRLRVRISSLADKVVAALEYQLDKKKSVQAAALALKVMGMDQPTDGGGSGNLTVVLPGSGGAPDRALTITPDGKPVK